MKKVFLNVIFLIIAILGVNAQIEQTNNISPAYTSEESTLRKGFELQGDVSYLYVGGNFGNSVGMDFTVNYRFTPTFALGAGFGSYNAYNDNWRWYPFFANVVWNFSRKKISPFVAAKIGLYKDDYPDPFSSPGSGIVPTPEETKFKFYIGLCAGVQYSLTKNFALKADVKADLLNIGVGIGVIYHF